MSADAPRPGRRAQAAAVRAERERLWAAGGLPEAEAWHAMSSLLTGVLLYGGAGWLLQQWLGWAWLTPIGLAVGMAAAVTSVWFRYGVDRSRAREGAVTSTGAGADGPRERSGHDRPNDRHPLEDLL
jgi:ATP synthase protein I